MPSNGNQEAIISYTNEVVCVHVCVFLRRVLLFNGLYRHLKDLEHYLYVHGYR